MTGIAEEATYLFSHTFGGMARTFNLISARHRTEHSAITSAASLMSTHTLASPAQEFLSGKLIHRCFPTVLFFLIAAVLSIPQFSVAAVWDYSCEGAIKNLKDEQEEVESAHKRFESQKNEMESASSMYDLCTPSMYDDCGFWLLNANNANQEYNDALRNVRRQLTYFGFAVDRFKRDCLQ